MKPSPSDGVVRRYAPRRVASRVAFVSLVSAVGLLISQSGALASGGLSSTVLSNTEPGLTVAPPGAYNGPITPSTLSLVVGSSSGATELDQGLSTGSVTAYLRLWDHQPKNGDAVVIAAFAFTNGSEEDSFSAGLSSGLAGRPGAQSFVVPGLSGAYGSTQHSTTSAGPLSEYAVSFEKGNTVFQVLVASSSGDLTSSDAVALATRQFANAPDVPASPCACVSGIRTNWWGVASLVGGIVLTGTVFAIGRKRKYPTALNGLLPPSDGHDGSSSVASSIPGGYLAPTHLSTDDGPKVSAVQWQ